MSSVWVYDLETSIYSRVKAVVTNKLKSKYPNLQITQDNASTTEAKFPTVYIHALQPYERGNDLENSEINAVSFTFEVEITVSKTQNLPAAREVSAVVVDAFKQLRFSANMPVFIDDKSVDTKRTISRFTRIIAYNDVIL